MDGLFLTYKSVTMRIDGFLTNSHLINAGVPQVSAFSPVLFIIFINDVASSPLSNNHSLLVMFNFELIIYIQFRTPFP